MFPVGISACITVVSTSWSSLNLRSPRFCFSVGKTWCRPALDLYCVQDISSLYTMFTCLCWNLVLANTLTTSVVSMKVGVHFWSGDFSLLMFQQDQDGTAVPSWSCCCSKAVYKPVWHIPLLSVQWITPDDGQRNCPKHLEFHSKINLRNRCI
jgi:hypothetical protein